MARTPPCAPTISTSPPAATTSSRSSSNKAVAAPSSVPTADRSNARWAAGGRARRRTFCHEAKHCRKRSCPPKRSSARPSCRSTRSTRNPGSWASVTGGKYRVRRAIPSTAALSFRAELEDALLDVTQPVLAEEDIVPDEERRCSERPALDRTLGVQAERVLDLASLDQLEESLPVQP